MSQVPLLPKAIELEQVGYSTDAKPPIQEPGPASQPLFLETVLQRFFQEKNIKWMLVMGAGIVFGSSLMLVTKAWPEWSLTLKYLTILTYTAIVFLTGEIARKRLGLTATYRVLHSLTLLLLPVCFLALTWLSPGTAMQDGWESMIRLGLLIPAIAFLWFAAQRILDHLLRSRQTTFLVSFCVFCVAGALPQLASPFAAMCFLVATWLVFTAGVLKVNRHTFWMAEEHQMPRVFGFLPIAMLGLQFVVLVSTKALPMIEVQWLGLGIVMAAATVLLTARTVADVFRQRTGDLVRPLPWHIAMPLLSGLVLTVVGVALSFYGFHYVGETTYAVIPTTILAAVLMALAAHDTRHRGFVWAALGLIAIAYQCSPTLFADIVQTMRETTADALQRERVPVSLYGLTYLPLLGTLAIASFQLAKREHREFSQPIKHFVTGVAVLLFAVSTTDIVSLFFVSTANAFLFVGLAIAFADRRYVIPAIIGLVAACGSAIPALADMGRIECSTLWVPTVLAGLATLMTATRIWDRMVNLITIPNAEESTRNDLLQRRDGSNRGLVQLIGCLLAGSVSIHWIGSSLVQFTQPLTQASMFEFAFLMLAFLLYTLRNPHYLSGLCIWGLIAFSVARYATGIGITIEQASTSTTYFALLAITGVYVLLKSTKWLHANSSLTDLRQKLGVDPDKPMIVGATEPASRGWTRQVQAFVVPLFDLSLVTLSCLVVGVHLPAIVSTHLDWLRSPASAIGSLEIATGLSIVWLMATALISRIRGVAILACVSLPVLVTATTISLGVAITPGWIPVVWASVQTLVCVICAYGKRTHRDHRAISALLTTSQLWLLATLALSCLWLGWAPRVAAAVCVIGLAIVARAESRKAIVTSIRWDKKSLTQLAIFANLHVLLLIATIAGASGFVIDALMTDSFASAIPFVFAASAVSILIFDRGCLVDQTRWKLDPASRTRWTSILRAALLGMTCTAIVGDIAFTNVELVLMVGGMALACVSEWIQAISRQHEARVWTACAVAGLATLFLFDQGVIEFGAGISQFVLLGLSVVALTLHHFVTGASSARGQSFQIIRRPMAWIGHSLPVIVTGLAVVREFGGLGDSRSAINAMSLMIASGIYFHQAMATRQRSFAIVASVIANIGLMLLWRTLHWNAAELYLVPIGLSILAFVELLKKELPTSSHDLLRYIGVLTILVSPMFEILGGSWLHMFALMVLSVLVILLSIGLRIRSLALAGSAFLVADLVAMVIRSTMDNPNLLWIGGVLLGGSVIALAAFCENHREKVLAQIRMVSAELATWN